MKAAPCLNSTKGRLKLASLVTMDSNFIQQCNIYTVFYSIYVASTPLLSLFLSPLLPPILFACAFFIFQLLRNTNNYN